MWMQRKISEPWVDGEVLHFRIDTNENTIVYRKGNTPEKTLRNILAFTNNRTYPDYLQVFAYCVYLPSSPQQQCEVKLSIL